MVAREAARVAIGERPIGPDHQHTPVLPRVTLGRLLPEALPQSPDARQRGARVENPGERPEEVRRLEDLLRGVGEDVAGEPGVLPEQRNDLR